MILKGAHEGKVSYRLQNLYYEYIHLLIKKEYQEIYKC